MKQGCVVVMSKLMTAMFCVLIVLIYKVSTQN